MNTLPITPHCRSFPEAVLCEYQGTSTWQKSTGHPLQDQEPISRNFLLFRRTVVLVRRDSATLHVSAGYLVWTAGEGTRSVAVAIVVAVTLSVVAHFVVIVESESASER